MITQIAHVALAYPHVVFSLTVIDKCTLGPDFSHERIRNRPNVSHLDHRLHEAPKEGVLAASKPVDDGRRRHPCTRVRLEFLVGLDESTVHLEICKVVIVEGVGCRGIEVV